MIHGEAPVLMSDGETMPARLLTRNSAVVTVAGKSRLGRSIIDGVIQSSARRLVRIYVTNVTNGEDLHSIECSLSQKFASPKRGPAKNAEDITAGELVYCYDGQMVYTARVVIVSTREERTEVQTFLPKIPGGKKRFIANGFVCVSA